MGLGPTNPLPMRVGGGPSPTWKAYQTLRQAVGKGGSAENDTGIDGLWRRSRAKGLAAATSSKRRALMQSWPQFATDFLPYYERRIGYFPTPDETETARRERVVAQWTKLPLRSWNDLQTELQAIDARFSLLVHDDTKEIVTIFGRAFDGYDLTSPAVQPPFVIPGGVTQYPAFSTRQVMRVQFTLGYAGVPTYADQVLLDRARDVLRRWLSSDTDFSITTGPWVLGTTPLGLGAL